MHDCAVPTPAADEVLVKVRACGVCRTDLHVVEGDLDLRRSPTIPGHQVVGVVEAIGSSVADREVGERVGVAWLHRACGRCRFCASERENLCEASEFTGWTVDGGFAEQLVAPASFTYPLPEGFSDLQAAPLLCAAFRSRKPTVRSSACGTTRFAARLFWRSNEKRRAPKNAAFPSLKAGAHSAASARIRATVYGSMFAHGRRSSR